PRSDPGRGRIGPLPAVAQAPERAPEACRPTHHVARQDRQPRKRRLQTPSVFPEGGLPLEAFGEQRFHPGEVFRDPRPMRPGGGEVEGFHWLLGIHGMRTVYGDRLWSQDLMQAVPRVTRTIST